MKLSNRRTRRSLALRAIAAARRDMRIQISQIDRLANIGSQMTWLTDRGSTVELGVFDKTPSGSFRLR